LEDASVTAATENDINELIHHLHAVRQPDRVIHELLVDFAQRVEARERERSLEIVQVAYKRISNAKGRSWRVELDEAEKEIRIGTTRLFADT
jgi:plasmid stabilization system protein ParE